MHSYKVNEIPLTFASNLIGSALLLSPFVALIAQPLAGYSTDQQFLLDNRAYSSTSPLTEGYSNLIHSVVGSDEGTFEDCISSFYSKLLNSQQSLDDTFARVLHENLSNLYE